MLPRAKKRPAHILKAFTKRNFYVPAEILNSDICLSMITVII